MKEELENLGFRGVGLNSFRLVISLNLSLEVCNNKEVWISNSEIDTIYLFPYNHEKLKQLIKILS